MQTQITHEAEVHRQHVRLQVPIAVEIDGNRYTCDDWSIGGFGVLSEMSSRQPGERFSVQVIFPFEDFEVTLQLDAQMVYILDDNTRFGCKFMSLSQGQLSLFRYLIDAYLSGELVSGGDVLSIAGRDNSASARLQSAGFNPYEKQDTFGRRLKRGLGYLFMLAIGLGILAFVGLGVNQNILTVRAENAVIFAPSTTIRAPLSGTVTRVDAPALLSDGSDLGRLDTVERGIVPLTSDCNCVVQQWHVPDGGFAGQGERIVTLVSSEEPLTVRAEVDYRDALDLRIGGQAQVQVPGQDITTGEIIDIDFRRGFGEEPRATRSMAVVTIRPGQPLDFDALGSLVDVTF